MNKIQYIQYKIWHYYEPHCERRDNCFKTTLSRVLRFKNLTIKHIGKNRKKKKIQLPKHNYHTFSRFSKKKLTFTNKSENITHKNSLNNRNKAYLSMPLICKFLNPITWVWRKQNLSVSREHSASYEQREYAESSSYPQRNLWYSRGTGSDAASRCARWTCASSACWDARTSQDTRYIGTPCCNALSSCVYSGRHWTGMSKSSDCRKSMIK